jgi:hypothetical protein
VTRDYPKVYNSFFAPLTCDFYLFLQSVSIPQILSSREDLFRLFSSWQASAIDVDINEVLALCASKGRGIPSAVKFLRKVLDSCEGKPVILE